ncbi:MAG: acyl-CoA synthetase FdrA [Candidatus Tectomicrobia bacterium]|nr:acyl-CoA synthetase FdrA [Candidatus Tectomicrobia bacterium]
MPRRNLVKRNHYQDSVRLLRIGEALRQIPGVERIGVVMATPANVALLEEGGLLTPEGREAKPNDLIIAVSAATAEALSDALARAEDLLSRPHTPAGGVCKTLRSALSALPGANVALISVPGEYAGSEARRALEAGLHVFLFSDNVPLEDEVDLKRLARARGLLVMGPDCGTAFLGGAGLGFVNVVSKGEVGIVAASGTGAQAVSVALGERGLGVSHIIGTGSRDASGAVGAITLIQGLRALGRDEATRVIVLVSKAPGPGTLARLFSEIGACPRKEQSGACGKPVVAYLVGVHPGLVRAAGAAPAVSLGHAAELAAHLAEGPEERTAGPSAWATAGRLAGGLPRESFLRGLFAGGTLAQEACAILSALLPGLQSNLAGPLQTPVSGGHRIVDLGADEYTVGRPHPMIDPAFQAGRIETEAADPRVGVILFDVVLGHGAHPDPAGVLAPAAERAMARASSEGRRLACVASLCGLDPDPQGGGEQERKLRAAGVIVERDNARAAAVTGLAVAAAGLLADGMDEEEPLVRLPARARVINIGADWFADALRAQGAAVAQVEWRPPAGGDPELARVLRALG